MKSWLKSKTVWLGFGVGILGVVQATLETAPIPEPWGGLALGVLGAAIVTLRALTTEPITIKKPEA